ncbi:centromere protein O, partial [Cinclus cinclus]|uniref:centromere protein O n=1 Tax=Cinclus cinclus TaxID=127875 RepID=UPI002E0F0B62
MDPDEEEQEKEGKLDFSQDSGTFSRNPRGPAPPPAPPSSPSTSQCREPEPPDGDGDGDERRLRRLRRRLRELRERLRERKEQGGGSLGTARGPREELQEQIRECRDLLSLFRLTGISGRLSQHGFSFSLHTAFEGRLLDRFELELRQFGEPREPRVGRHCIPPFVPLQRLSRQCLPRRPRRFLELLLLHL